MHRVKIIGWRTGLLKVSMTKIIKARFGYGLSQAKHCTDSILGGEEITLECLDEINAREAAQELHEIGAEISLELCPRSSHEKA